MATTAQHLPFLEGKFQAPERERGLCPPKNDDRGTDIFMYILFIKLAFPCPYHYRHQAPSEPQTGQISEASEGRLAFQTGVLNRLAGNV